MEFLANVSASLVATILFSLICLVGYIARKQIIRGFWELSREHVEGLIPTEKKIETRETNRVDHDRKEIRLTLDEEFHRSRQEFEYRPPGVTTSIALRLVEVRGSDVVIQDLSSAGHLAPYFGVESENGSERVYKLTANKDRNRRGKMIRFDDYAGTVATSIIHAENVSEDSQAATIVIETFKASLSSNYDSGL
jgi:hypothetical protein